MPARVLVSTKVVGYHPSSKTGFPGKHGRKSYQKVQKNHSKRKSHKSKEVQIVLTRGDKVMAVEVILQIKEEMAP
jgi:hypothetical protein